MKKYKQEQQNLDNCDDTKRLGTLDFEAYSKERNLPQYRIKQFNQSIFQQSVNSFDKITGLPNQIREDIKSKMLLSSLTPSHTSIDRNSIKIIFKTQDSTRFETVLISEKNRNTICISTQIGCPMGCAFCATGRLGFTRNLSVQEIIDQIMYLKRLLNDPTSDQQLLLKNSKFKIGDSKDITNIVIMGMGEPLLNLQNVLKSIEIITSAEYINIGARNITLSTVGIIDMLPDLLKEKHQFKIAFSLHSANQLIRERIIPSARYNPLDRLISLFYQYAQNNNKRVSFEYIFLQGINNSINDAYELIDLIKPFKQLAFINIINYNRGKDDPDITRTIRIDDIRKQNYRSSQNENRNNDNIYSESEKRRISNRLLEIDEFTDILKRNGINVFIRISRGNEINGACGMLANKYNK